MVLQLIKSLTPLRPYQRKSSAYFRDSGKFVPFPVQNHLGHFPQDIAAKALVEILESHHRLWSAESKRVMSEWMKCNFGATLFELFFRPFHEKYTSGLWDRIAPQDVYKTPLDLEAVKAGATGNHIAPAGYNTSYFYPQGGLDKLAGKMAKKCRIRYRSELRRIHLKTRTLELADGSRLGWDSLLCTLPLHQILRLAGLKAGVADPATSVLVLNIAGDKGPECPQDHWVYTPQSQAGFHRVGFYGNVEPDFLPASSGRERLLSMYVEFSFREGKRPTAGQIARLGSAAVKELRDWNWLRSAAICDPTWINTAYTWSWPSSTWKAKAARELGAFGIFPIGRYGRWVFQGIAESIKEGLVAGASLRMT